MPIGVTLEGSLGPWFMVFYTWSITGKSYLSADNLKKHAPIQKLQVTGKAGDNP
jgi:hypothetical protein